MNTLASGAGQFVGNYALGMMPASVGPLAGAGIVAAAGMAGDYVGVNSHLAAGMGGAGVNAAVSNLMDGAETPVNGIGRRRLSAADVKRIEAAARSRNISGLTDETLTGRDPVQARYNLF